MVSRKGKKLTAKEKRFVEEFLIDLNGTQAALRAGYSPRTAKSQAHGILKRPEVQEALSKAFEKRSKRTEITQDMVLTELAKIGFQDIRKAVAWGISPIDDTSENADKNGLGIYPVRLVPSELVDEDTAAAISEVSLTQNGIKIKMHDKQAALVSIGKHLGMFTEKHEVTGKNGGPIEVSTKEYTDEQLDQRIKELTAKVAEQEGKENG